MKVKICGITNYDDAMYAADAGTDALGFVFYPKSPRFISYEECAKIIEKLPPFITKVGLFVNNTKEEIEKGFLLSKIDIAQIHFDVDETFLQKLNVKYLPVVRAKKAEDIEKYASSFRIIDAFTPEYGGSGKRVNLEWFKNKDCSKIILAGGLTPQNLDQIQGFNFYGVDVSSGVEAYKGKKDFLKVKQFIKNAKNL